MKVVPKVESARNAPCWPICATDAILAAWLSHQPALATYFSSEKAKNKDTFRFVGGYQAALALLPKRGEGSLYGS